MSGALPMGENLKQRNINPDAQCPFCGEDETGTHLFANCSFATQVWKAAPFKIAPVTQGITSIRALIEQSKTLICLPPCGISQGPLTPWIIWSIWLARNNLVFNGKHINPMEVLSQAIFVAREWHQAQTTTLKPPIRNPPIPNHRTNPSEITCHTDAAWNIETKAAGLDWIFNPIEQRSTTQGSTYARNVRSPLVAETLAILHAVQMAADLGMINLHIASDSKQAIEAINSGSPIKEIHGMQYDILILSSKFQKIRFSFIPGSCNREADAIAKFALNQVVVNPV
ncbi:PREDICTED: uncharacterized protein LOC104753190 [Camelina sativa]|uniref:Uncharacterized protein LOC104753190 n=1 Tax=Camelina sativa TaxID=90675 RepID=A0ABM0WNS1_CAMSA|nr:PREDICTED: uncharacterized protein LOC104753190 [Camelina sativa]